MHHHILLKFSFSNSTEDVIETVTGTGVITNANSLATVSTGAGIGTAQMRSRRFVNSRPAHEIHSVLSAIYPSANIDANTYQYAGLIKTEDALAFGRNGTSFGILYRSFSADTFIPQTSWNKDKLDGSGISKFILDDTKLNQYRFLFDGLGVTPVYCQVYGGIDIGWITVHVIDDTNISTVTAFQNPAFPMAVEVGRTVGTGAVTVSTGSWAASIAESDESHAGHRVFAGEIDSTLVANTETYLGTFVNKDTYQSQTNTVQAHATFMSFATDGTKSVKFRGYSNVTSIATSTAYNPVDVDTANSIIALDTTSTTFNTGKFEFPIVLDKVGQVSLDLSNHFHLELQPGESFTLTALSTLASDISLGVRWEELHS